MKIPPAQVETARIALPQASTENARAAEAAETRAMPAPVRGDRVELSGPGQSPAERVDQFASTVMDRLAKLAEEEGLDLSEVEGAFAENIGRIQAGLADGSLGGADLGAALANTLDLLREDVRAATAPEVGEREGAVDGLGDGTNVGELAVDPGPPAPPSDAASRVEDVASTLADRIQALLSEAEGPVAEGLVGALEQFGENVDRILAGLADGSMTTEQVAQALQNTLDFASQDVARALALGAGETDDRSAPTAVAGDGAVVDRATDVGGGGAADAAGPAETRYDAFTAQVLERLGGLDTSGLSSEGQAALAELTESFRSATARLDQAFFEDGSLDRDQFLELFSAAYSELESELGGIFGSDGAPVQLYDPRTGTEALSGYPVSRLDATV